jgi:hypothetical protein
MKKIILSTCLPILCLLFFWQGSAQNEIKNTIYDFSTQEPVMGANIYIKNTTIGTISNEDGKFLLQVPKENQQDTLIISSIGYKSFKTAIKDFDAEMPIFLDQDVASLDEVVIIAETRPKTGNDIVLRAIEKLEVNLPDSSFIQKGFLRHRERNKKQYKWLIESALSLYDSSFAVSSKNYLKINVDENRKSFDLRDVDSMYAYYSYLKYNTRKLNLKKKQLRRDTIKTTSLIKAIRWNDKRVNGLGNLFKGKLNLLRNIHETGALFGKDMLTMHQFTLDTILVDEGRKLYKIKISKGKEYVGLKTPYIYNEGFTPEGWIYIYWDNFAVKKIEYTLIAASEAQRKRSKSLFDTLVNHKLVLSYKEFDDKMYLNYVYYETPKLVKVGDRSSDNKTKSKEELLKDKEEQFYYTIQEIVFTEILQDPAIIKEALAKKWSDDIFEPRPYNQEFWKNYNVLLESQEEEKLIQDLSTRASLYKQ